MRILLVDKSKGALAFQETALRRKDKSVATATSGDEAMARIRSWRPRLAIFAFDLDDMTGPEFCRLVRDDDELREVSLLFVAERNHEDHVDLCMAAGCNDIVFRPLHKDELDSKIEKLTLIPVRKRLRTLTKLEVMVGHQRDYYVLGHSLNLSASGILVESDHVLSPRAAIRLQFYLAGDAAPLHIESRIVRAEFTGASARYGMRFIEISAEQRLKITRFVDRLRARELQ